MKIGILEDEMIWKKKIQDVIETYCSEKSISREIHTYSSGAECLKQGSLDLLFLDVELLGGENGFKIAERIGQSGSQCKIIFVTSRTELSRQGYRYNAFRYIDKMHLEEIEEAIGSFMRTKVQDRIVCCNEASGIRVQMNLKDILLIETNGRKLRYLMRDGSEHFCEGLISNIAKDLSQYGFYRIQRSYIVNFRYIDEVNSRAVTLCNGMMIMIGRVHSKEFKKAFFEWRMKFQE